MFSGNIDPNINIIGDPPTAPDVDAGEMPFDALPTESASAVAQSALSSRPIRAKRPTLKAAETQDYTEGRKEQKAAVRARVNAENADEMAGVDVNTKTARDQLRRTVVRERTVESAKAKRARKVAQKRRNAKMQEMRTRESESDPEQEALARAQSHESVDIGVVNFPPAVTDDVCKETLGRYRDLL